MANTYHDQLTGSDLHANKIDPTTGTELTVASQTTYDGRWAQRSGSTMTGALTLAADPCPGRVLHPGWIRGTLQV